MGKKAEKIAEILEKEKKTIEEEKRKKDIAETARQNAERNRKERLEKKDKLQEKWAMYRWTVEYIAENTDRWETEKKEREKERKETIQEWDKKSRWDKIKTLKEKWKTQTTDKGETQKREKKAGIWSIWREKEKDKTERKHSEQNMEKEKNEEKEQEQIYPIFLKMRKPKIEVKTKERENPDKTRSQVPSPRATQVKNPSKPDDNNSQKVESNAKGLPPVQVASSEGHLHEGHLGEVTNRGGVVTSPTPPKTPTTNLLKEEREREIKKKMYPMFEKIEKTKEMKQETKTIGRKETVKSTARKKQMNSEKENAKYRKGMMAWLGKEIVNAGMSYQNPSNGAACQNTQMAMPSGGSKNPWLEISEHRRKCQANIENENEIIIASRSEISSTMRLSESE